METDTDGVMEIDCHSVVVLILLLSSVKIRELNFVAPLLPLWDQLVSTIVILLSTVMA